MTSPRPTFRVMKNGYDRFAVDDAVDRYASRVDQLEKKLTVYQQQLEENNARLIKLQAEYQTLENSVDAQRQAAENIARLSLREANEIIETARQNADAASSMRALRFSTAFLRASRRIASVSSAAVVRSASSHATSTVS